MGATTFKMAKLYTTKGNVNGFKAMVAALYNGGPLQVPDNFDIATHASTAEYLAISPMGEVPCLETACGAAISQPDAILRFVMRSNLASQIYGRCAVEQGQVDQFIEFAKTKLEAPLNAWTYPIHGLTKYNHQVVEQAMKDVPVALAFLEAHLASRTFLVGQCVTGADIACALAMLDASTVVFDGKFRAPFPNVFRWFTTCVNQPQFAAVIGAVTLCVEAKSAKPAKAAPKAKAPKPAQQPKKKKEKKPKSAMVLDEFKRQSSNNEAPVFFDWLSKNFDSEGYCWYFAKYQSPNDFNKLFNANNLLNGFIQRLDGCRKYGFASFCICGDAQKPPWNIYGIFMFRGNEVPFECLDCPDSEVYDFVKCDPSNPEDKLKMECLMAAEGEWFTQQKEECQTWKAFK